MLQSLVNELRKALPGYHLEVSIFPSGGNIDADALKTLRLKLGIDATP